MGKEKAGFLTPKAIGNRIKAKGLQKLRWYCQMCQKQCRDENGFKCHCMSESHQRQMLLFADNSDEYLDSFSKEFMDMFIDLLSRRYGTRRVHCNIVYNEFISDREHTHMNSTKWHSLTEFIMYLGKEGAVAVDPTEKGIFITWIDRDPETLKRQEILLKREKFEALEAEKAERQLEEQIARGQEQSKPVPESVFTELKRDENSSEKVAFSLAGAASSGATSASTSSSAGPEERGGEAAAAAAGGAATTVTTAGEFGPAPAPTPTNATVTAGVGKPLLTAKLNPLEEAARKAKLGKLSVAAAGGGGGESKKRKSALEQIMEEEEQRKKRRMMTSSHAPSSLATVSLSSSKKSLSSSKTRVAVPVPADAWLIKGIVVKVADKHHDLYKSKCVVEEVADRGRTALLRNPDGAGEPAVPVADSDLETVIPAVGRSVVVLRGEHRGQEAILEKINVDKFCVNVTTVRRMKELKRVPYEDVSKMATKK